MRLYVFLTKRPQDKQAWPLVYQSEQLANDAPHRVSPVMLVDVSEYSTSETSSAGEGESQ